MWVSRAQWRSSHDSICFVTWLRALLKTDIWKEWDENQVSIYYLNARKNPLSPAQQNIFAQTPPKKFLTFRSLREQLLKVYVTVTLFIFFIVSKHLKAGKVAELKVITANLHSPGYTFSDMLRYISRIFFLWLICILLFYAAAYKVPSLNYKVN